MSIKVFRFRVSNAASHMLTHDGGNAVFQKLQDEIDSPQTIEETVNAFLLSTANRVIDIKINEVEVHYHNNGRGNTVDLIYTILYE